MCSLKWARWDFSLIWKDCVLIWRLPMCLFHTVLCPFTRGNWGNSMNARNIILMWEQQNPNISVFHSGFVGSTGAALQHQKGWAGHKDTGNTRLHCQVWITPASWPGGFWHFQVFIDAVKYLRDVSSVVCFIFKCKKTLLPPKSVPVKRMKL